MRIWTFLLLVVGAALMLFGLLFFSTGGPCRAEVCGPGLNAISFWAGGAMVGIAVLVEGYRVVRSPTRADRDAETRR